MSYLKSEMVMASFTAVKMSRKSPLVLKCSYESRTNIVQKIMPIPNTCGTPTPYPSMRSAISKSGMVNVRMWPKSLRSARTMRSEEHTSELQSHVNLVCRLLLEKKNKKRDKTTNTGHIQIGKEANRDRQA